MQKRVIFMEQSQELSKALEELTRATGVALDIHIQPEASKEKIDESIRQIRSLCAAYKEKYKSHDRYCTGLRD